MQKVIFRLGILLLVVLPVVYGIEIYRTQDLPSVPMWGWATLVGAVLLIVFARNKDEVINHHLPH